MIGIRDFAKMKKSTIFINIARGKVIDEFALIQALRYKDIAPLVLMFFKREPLPHNSQLLEMDNFTLTPHIAFLSFELLEECTRVRIQNIENSLKESHKILCIGD